ncbi:MAG TPA: ferrochelatase [Candidatus Thermoplasmatota archaeon]|nr:ferrochelatase [Candidatus Thermoplasmatota archaeon]
MDGILLAGYGSPDGLDDVARYLRHIIPSASDEAVDDLRARYAAVGGRTPFVPTSLRTGALLQKALGQGTRVEVGFKHCAPSIEDATRALVERGAERGVVLPLAAHNSRKSIGGYHQAARDALAQLPGAPPFGYVHGFATHPLFLGAWAERVRAGQAQLPRDAQGQATVLFTAHSLPSVVRTWNDPYEGEVRASCEGVAELAGLGDWAQCWTSAAGKDWLEPDVLDFLPELAKRGARGVVAAPIGFVSDHLETLYDIDIEAAAKAEELGLAWVRCPALNDDPRFIAMLADVAQRALPSTRA